MTEIKKSQNNYFTVLTEEKPNIDEIKLMIKLTTCHNIDSVTQADIVPDISHEGCFKGRWSITHSGLQIYILLFKGSTASVDYILFAGKPSGKPSSKLLLGNAEDALCILESNKTSDKESRNTAVYQRISKFTTFFNLYPKSKCIPVMFWLNSSWSSERKLTATANFGFRIMITLGIRLFMNSDNKLIDLVDTTHLKPFQTSDELIAAKNLIKQKKGNSSVYIKKKCLVRTPSLHTRRVYTLCGMKLDKGKGNNAGKVSHDPNVGFLCGVTHCIYKLDKKSTFIIKDHNIQQTYFNKKPKSKLWFSIGKFDVIFDGVKIQNLPPLPTRYFKLESKMTEKLATLLCDLTSNHKTIFSNHGGCALTAITGPNGDKSIGRKMHRPDIMFLDDSKQEIIIIEGKVEKDLKKGLYQLSQEHLKEFVSLTKILYPNYKIKKGLCITIDDIKNISKYISLTYPVLFALDSQGKSYQDHSL